MEKEIQLPEEFADVMVAYMKNGQKVCKHGFYSKLFKNFAIPPEWRHFEIGGEQVLLPHGWGGDHVKPENVISWEYINKNQKYV